MVVKGLPLLSGGVQPKGSQSGSRKEEDRPPENGERSMAARDPETRKLIARAAAFARSAKHDPGELARRGQRGLLRRFEAEVEAAEPGLSPEERDRRVEALRMSHMLRL